MKILFMLPYVPIPPTFGGALRVYYLIKLAAQHHDISIFTFGRPDDEQKLRSNLGPRIKDIYIIPRHWPRKMRRIAQFYSLFTFHSFFYMLAHSKEAQRILDQILNDNEFDIIQTEFAHMASYRINTNAIKILDSHNVEYDNFRRIWKNSHSPLRKLHYLGEYKKFYGEEIDACRRYDAMFVTSSRDKDILDNDVPGISKYVVPNGVDATYFVPTSEPVEPWSLVFTGAMNYVPNYDGILHFLDTTFPIILKEVPKTKVYIVGSRPPNRLLRRASDNIIITGYVDDVRPYIRRSSVYIVPLRMGSGTRLKVFEALSMKKPIVSTSVGCEGIDVVNGESVLIADNPETFARAVIQLFHDTSLREKLIRNGYDIMKAKYEWSVIGDQMETLYQTLCMKSKHKLSKTTTSIAIG